MSPALEARDELAAHEEQPEDSRCRPRGQLEGGEGPPAPRMAPTSPGPLNGSGRHDRGRGCPDHLDQDHVGRRHGRIDSVVDVLWRRDAVLLNRERLGLPCRADDDRLIPIVGSKHSGISDGLRHAMTPSSIAAHVMTAVTAIRTK